METKLNDNEVKEVARMQRQEKKSNFLNLKKRIWKTKYTIFGGGLKKLKIKNNKELAWIWFLSLPRHFLALSLIVIHKIKEMRL